MSRRAFGMLAVVGLLTATLAGCAGAKRPAVGIRTLLLEVRKAFGDDILRSASVKGSTLTVTVAFPDHPLSETRASFEAQMLAAAFHESVRASGRTPISEVKLIDLSGKPIDGAPVVATSDLSPLPPGWCMTRAKTVQAEAPYLTIRSALTLPYAGGACAFTFQAPVGLLDKHLVSKRFRGISDPDERASFLEIDDGAG